MSEKEKEKEVAHYPDVSQFERGESAYECGFFTVALNAAAGQEEPVHSPEWIDQQADKWYTDMDGLNTTANKNGMSLWQLYVCLKEYAGLHYQGFKPSLDWIRGYVKHGYPVVLCVDEKSVFDIGYGDRVPYPWKPTGTHIITVTGLVGDNFLVRDTASIKADDSLNAQPRIYDAGKLAIISSTAIVLPWLSRPQAGYDPTVTDLPPSVEHSYEIVQGDTLSSIAANHNVSVAFLLSKNHKVLDDAARQYGHISSDYGNFIFPGTILHW